VIAGYPADFGAIAAWAAEHRMTVTEARLRFAQYAVLQAIAASRTLSSVLVFKGGNALDFIWQPNRSTVDLDFSADLEPGAAVFTVESLKDLFSRSLDAVGRRLGIVFVVHKVEQQPPGLNRTFITYEVVIGYALPDDTGLRERMAKGRPSTQVIPVEISLNEAICAAETVALDNVHRLRVSTVEDIVAEKLRALLQQPIRNRTRPQDLLDIAVILSGRPNLDRTLVAVFLLQKAVARSVPVSRAAFRRPEIAARARQDYAGLRPTTRAVFIPVEEALTALHTLVDSLDIAEGGEGETPTPGT
jgi:predicted nucleotidyltransferase component of viral defense system